MIINFNFWKLQAWINLNNLNNYKKKTKKEKKNKRRFSVDL